MTVENIGSRPPIVGRGADRVLQPIVERLLFSARMSSRPSMWTGVHLGVSAPLLAFGRVRHYAGTIDGEPMRVTAIGRERRFRALIERHLDRVDSVELGRWAPLVSVDVLSHFPSDATAVEIHPARGSRFREAGWITVPERVMWEAPVAELPPSSPVKSLRSDLTKIARGGFEHEVVTAPAASDWREFEQAMATSHALRRFGPDAWAPSRPFIRRLERRGGLLFLRDRGRRVAGVCMLCEGDLAWMPLLGVRDGDPALIDQGAIAHLYMGAVRWAARTGALSLNCGRTSAFIDDGVARYKRKWGFNPTADPLSPLIALRVRPGHNALSPALKRHPVLTVVDGGLRRFPAEEHPC